MKYPLSRRWILLFTIATCAFLISLHILYQAKGSLYEDIDRGLDSSGEDGEGVVYIEDQLPSNTAEEVDEEKFMTFYLHSGLHNQRLSLLNAAVTAKLLNRTLIIPEANIAVATFWKNSTDLPEKLHYCPDMVAAHRQMEKELGQRIHLPSECFDYRHYVPISFTDLFDLSPLTAVGIRYHLRDDMHYSYFQKAPLNIPNDERNRSLVYQIEDADRYSYRLYDSVSDNSPLFSFSRRLNIDDLKHRPERLIIFNSMFGSKRLALDADNKRIFNLLTKSIAIQHPVVDSNADHVISRLGGRGQYISAHIRTGDGIFKQHITDTVQKIKTKLDRLVDAEEQRMQENTLDELRMLQLRQTPESINTLLNRCVQFQPQGGKLTTLFMATDSKNPRNDPNMRSLFHEFVCSFTLADFPDILDSMDVKSPRDNHTDISSLLIPLLDAVIASYGNDFVGTPGSTFSGYVKTRQEALSDQVSSPTL
jgi:hypothetical protein